MYVELNSEHLKRVGRTSQRLECWIPLEEWQELLLQGWHLLEIQWKVTTRCLYMLMMQWMLMLVNCMIPPSGTSRSTNKDQGTFRGGGMGVKIHRHAYLINICATPWMGGSKLVKQYSQYIYKIYLDWFLKRITASAAASMHTLGYLALIWWHTSFPGWKQTSVASSSDIRLSKMVILKIL